MATKETTYTVVSKKKNLTVETVESFNTKRAALVAAQACANACEYVTVYETVMVKVRGRRWVNVYPYSRKRITF